MRLQTLASKAVTPQARHHYLLQQQLQTAAELLTYAGWIPALHTLNDASQQRIPAIHPEYHQ